MEEKMAAKRKEERKKEDSWMPKANKREKKKTE